MFCPNCGNKLPENTDVCPACGAAIPQKNNIPDENSAPVPAAGGDGNAIVFTGFETLKKVFSSSLFLALCIVISAAAALGIISETFDLYAILGAIACWIIYANAKSSDPLKQSGYKFAAVITRIMYVINWVCIGLIAVSGAIVSALFFYSDSMLEQLLTSLNTYFPNVYYDLMSELEELTAELSDVIAPSEFMSYASWGFAIAVIVVAVIAIAVMIVYNLCFVRPLDKYTHSLSDSFVTGSVTVYNKSLATRFLVFGIINAVFSLGSISGLTTGNTASLAVLCSLAIFFICYALINSAKDEQ